MLIEAWRRQRHRLPNHSTTTCDSKGGVRWEVGVHQIRAKIAVRRRHSTWSSVQIAEHWVAAFVLEMLERTHAKYAKKRPLKLRSNGIGQAMFFDF